MLVSRIIIQLSLHLKALHDYKRRQNEEFAAEMKAEVQRRVAEVAGTGSSLSVVKTTAVLRLRVVDVFEQAKKKTLDPDDLVSMF
jgi:hypothetical protein